MTRFNASSLLGMQGAIDRKATSPVYPQVGHMFCNLPIDVSGSGSPSAPSGQDKDADPMLVHVMDVCQSMAASLNRLHLKSQPMYRTNNVQPINLYHKAS